MPPTQGEHAQPEALRLAESITRMDTFTDFQRQELDKAAAKLRSLHAQVAAQPAAPQGGAYVENPAEIEHVAGDVSKNRAESNMTGGAYAELPEPPRAYAGKERGAWEHGFSAGRASHGQASAGATLDVFGLQWPGEDRINLSTVFDTEAEALEYRDNLCDTPGILVVRLSAQPTHTAQPAPAATPQADSQPAPQGEPWYGHHFKEVRRGYWQCSCGKAIAEATSTTSNDCYPPLPNRHAYDDDGDELFTADQMRAYVDADRAARSPADSVTAPAAGAVAGPVNRIPLLDENDPGCALVRTTRGWDFRRNGNLIRHLNLYERLFVESALAAAPTPAAQGDALDRVTNFRHEAEGMVRGGEWVRLSDVRAALAQKGGA